MIKSKVALIFFETLIGGCVIENQSQVVPKENAEGYKHDGADYYYQAEGSLLVQEEILHVHHHCSLMKFSCRFVIKSGTLSSFYLHLPNKNGNSNHRSIKSNDYMHEQKK
jgi:hypothetical protein